MISGSATTKSPRASPYTRPRDHPRLGSLVVALRLRLHLGRSTIPHVSRRRPGWRPPSRNDSRPSAAKLRSPGGSDPMVWPAGRFARSKCHRSIASFIATFPPCQSPRPKTPSTVSTGSRPPAPVFSSRRSSPLCGCASRRDSSYVTFAATVRRMLWPAVHDRGDDGHRLRHALQRQRRHHGPRLHAHWRDVSVLRGHARLARRRAHRLRHVLKRPLRQLADASPPSCST